MFRIKVWVGAVFMLCTPAVAAQQAVPPANPTQSNAVVILFGCVNNSTGAIRIASNATVCKTTEHKIHWNQKGPQGPGITRVCGPARGCGTTRSSGTERISRIPGAAGSSGNPGGLLGCEPAGHRLACLSWRPDCANWSRRNRGHLLYFRVRTSEHRPRRHGRRAVLRHDGEYRWSQPACWLQFVRQPTGKYHGCVDGQCRRCFPGVVFWDAWRLQHLIERRAHCNFDRQHAGS